MFFAALQSFDGASALAGVANAPHQQIAADSALDEIILRPRAQGPDRNRFVIERSEHHDGYFGRVGMQTRHRF